MLPFFLGLILTANINPQVLTVDISVAMSTPQEIWIERLHQCENPDNIPWIWDTNGKKSYGYVMFQMGTWLKYTKQGATRANIGDDEMQKIVARYILDTKGADDWWTCGHLVAKTIGAYPSS